MAAFPNVRIDSVLSTSGMQVLILVSQSQSQSQTLYLPLPATRGGKGLAHTNRASGSGLNRKTVEEIKLHSMNLIKDGTCQNDFCVNKSCITNVGLASLTMSCLHKFDE